MGKKQYQKYNSHGSFKTAGSTLVANLLRKLGKLTQIELLSVFTEAKAN